MKKNRILAMALAMSITVSACVAVDAQAASYQAGTTYTRVMQPANIDFQTGQYQKAEARYTAMLKRNPRNTEARALLSVAQAELYKLDAAEKNAKEVLSRNSRNADAHAALGIVYRNRTASMDMTYRANKDEYLSRSASELEQAVRLAPHSPEAHNQLGITYRFQGRTEDAKREFEKALDLDPEMAEALLNQGIMLYGNGQISDAKQLYQQAIRANSKNHAAHYRLAEAQAAEGDYHGALKSLNTAASLSRDNAAILGKMAEVNDLQGNHAAAVANYRKAMHSNPGYMPAYTGMARLYDKRGDGELAMAELRSALNVNPKFTEGHKQLAHLALTVDKPDQALRHYEEAMKISPNDPEVLEGMSQTLTVIAQKSATQSAALGQESDMVDAEKAIARALQYNPNDLRLHLASVRIGRLTGKPSPSKAELERLVSQPAHTETEAMAQGEALLALGRYQEADAVFNHLMNNAQHEDQLLVLGDTLKINGDLKNAEKAYLTALHHDPENLKAKRGIQRIEQVQAESQKNLRLAEALNNWRQKESSIDFYEEALQKNPRQPEARLSLAKLYEKHKAYDQAASSYRHYLGLMPSLEEKKRQRYEKKIAKLQQKAAEQAASMHTQAGAAASTSPY